LIETRSGRRNSTRAEDFDLKKKRLRELGECPFRSGKRPKLLDWFTDERITRSTGPYPIGRKKECENKLFGVTVSKGGPRYT